MFSVSQLLAQSRARQLLMIEDDERRKAALQKLAEPERREVIKFMRELRTQASPRLAHITA
jgi:hypothetical protein